MILSDLANFLTSRSTRGLSATAELLVPTTYFKVTPMFDAEYVINGTK